MAHEQEEEGAQSTPREKLNASLLRVPGSVPTVPAPSPSAPILPDGGNA